MNTASKSGRILFPPSHTHTLPTYIAIYIHTLSVCAWAQLICTYTVNLINKRTSLTRGTCTSYSEGEFIVFSTLA